MKKYDVWFCADRNGNAVQLKTLLATSEDDAFQKYLAENYSEDCPIVYVRLKSLFAAPKVFDNPKFPTEHKCGDGNVKNSVKECKSSVNLAARLVQEELDHVNIKKLDRLIEIQEKQLYWIRIIGMPVMFAAIGAMLTLLASFFR